MSSRTITTAHLDAFLTGKLSARRIAAQTGLTVANVYSLANLYTRKTAR